MKLRTVRIRGFGPISEPVELDFLDGFTCVTGPTGSGKTTLFEALSLALYGETPGYPGLSVYDHITDGESEGEVEVFLECGGHEYRVIRKAGFTEKTQNNRAWVYRDGERIAGPRVREVDLVVAREIASREIAFATIMSGQRIVGDLCYGQPADRSMTIDQHRRNILCDILRACGLNKLSDRFLIRARRLGDHADILEKQAHAGDNLAGHLESTEAEMKSKKAELGTTREKLTAAWSNLESRRNGLRRLEAEGRDAFLSVIERHKQADAAAQDAKSATERARLEVEGICQKAKGVDDARADVQAAAHLKGKRDNLEALDMAHRKYRDWSMRAEQLKAAQDKAGARRDQMAEKTRISDVDRAASESLESLRQDYSTANDRNQEIQKANESLRTKIETARRELETLNARKADIEKRLSGKPETPGGSDVCAACPLLSEYRDLPERAAELAAQIVKAAKAVEALEAEPHEEAADLTDLVRRGEAARAARERVEAAEGHAAEFERAQTDLDNASMALRQHEENAPEAVDDVSAELSTVRRELDALSGAEERLRAAEEASVALEDAEKRLVECEARGCEASAVAVGLEAEADSARRALEEKDAATKGLREKISSAEAEASRLDSLVSDIAGCVGSLESTIRHLGETIEQHRAKAEEAATLRGRETACRFLRQAFGPKGIQALLVDQHAAPALEEIADKIFQTASDGQMRLRIVTQERDSKGGMKEAFSILVSGVDGARDFADIRKYSGGEQSMIRFVFRVALLIFVMQKTGRDLSILMLDEPLEGMSDNWRRAALATIREYLPQFSQVIVVTHDASFSANCDHRITVEKTPLGARISGGAITQESPVLVGA